ncbi:ABC transporter substrate-binding protein [bacterium 210820-DFI.6.37]|nr:ABC transporter substrate-binding protein [bacterium 210820-DFI.6.37]
MKRGKRFILLVIAVLAVSVLAAGCGSGGEETADSGDLDKLTVQSLWLPQGQFAGLYTALEKGYYEEEGIDLEILPGGTDVTAEDQVENDVAQIGMCFYISLLTYQESGADFVNVFQTMQTSPQWLVTKKDSGITSGKDLKGKKVGSWFGGRQYELYALAQKYGYDPEKDVEWVQQDYTMDQFDSGELDAASAMSYNEYLLLLEEEYGYDEDDLNVIDMNEEGVAMLEDCLFVKKSWAEENKDLLVRFLRATIKGWKYAAENPEEAGEIVYNVGESATLEHQVAMTKQVLESVLPDGADSSKIGYLDPERIQQTIDLGKESGLISKDIDINDSIDSSYWEEAIGQ